MNSLLPLIGVLFAAAITPGPNNVIVMQAGARGMAPVIGAVLGVVSGSVVLLILTWFGFGFAMSVIPAFTVVLHILCGAYLAWMGLTLSVGEQPTVANGMAPSTVGEQPTVANGMAPSTPLGIAVFQLVNPKAWILAAAAVGAMPQGKGLAVLMLLMVAVTSACLVLWALAGTAAARVFARPEARRVIDRILGAVLILSALGIVADVFNT